MAGIVTTALIPEKSASLLNILAKSDTHGFLLLLLLDSPLPPDPLLRLAMLIPLETPLAIDALLVPDTPLELDSRPALEPLPALDSPLAPLLPEEPLPADSPLEPDALLAPDSLLTPDAPLELDALIPPEEPPLADPRELPLDPLPLDEPLEPLELPLPVPLEPLEPGTGLGPGLGEDPLGLGLGMGDTPLALEVGFRGVAASLSEWFSINISLRFLSGTQLRSVGYDSIERTLESNQNNDYWILPVTIWTPIIFGSFNIFICLSCSTWGITRKSMFQAIYAL